MGCKVIFAPQAIADLEEAVRRVAKDDPITSKRIGNALIDHVAILETFPLLGSPYPKRVGVRKLVSHQFKRSGSSEESRTFPSSRKPSLSQRSLCRWRHLQYEL